MTNSWPIKVLTTRRLGKRQVRWLITLVIGVIIIYVWPLLQSSLTGVPAANSPSRYYVTRVYDGDTIEVSMNGTPEKIRLIGIDTPETHDPDTPAQCYGEHASQATTDALLHTSVRLEADPTGDNRDRYDRLLRYVFTSDETLWNKELITRGEAFAYISFPFVRKVEFMTAQFEAAREKRGLWSACETSEKNGRWRTNSVGES